jgi:hypothetical protein
MSRAHVEEHTETGSMYSCSLVVIVLNARDSCDQLRPLIHDPLVVLGLPCIVKPRDEVERDRASEEILQRRIALRRRSLELDCAHHAAAPRAEIEAALAVRAFLRALT